MMGPLFIGLNPSKHPGINWENNPSFAKLFDWTRRIHVKHFSFVNVSHEGGTFDKDTLDIIFLDEIVSEHNGPVIALGREVASVLTHMRISHFKAPHPSPLNRLLNDPDYEVTMLEHMKEFIVNEYERKSKDRRGQKLMPTVD